MPDGGVSAAVFAASKIAASAALAATGSTAVASAAFSATSFILSAKGALLLTTATSQVAMSANRRLPDPGTEIELSIDSDEPRRWIVGKRMTSGSIADRVAFDSVGGDKFDTHALIIVLADHQVNRMVRVIGDGLQVHGALQHGVRTALPEYNADDVGGSVGRNRIWMTFYDGRPGQPADPNLIAKTTGFNVIGRWTSEHRLEGLPYVIVEMKYDDDSLTSYPKFQFELEGALLYDRRKDSTAGGDGAHRIDDPATWEYSTNPAVARDHYRQGVIHPSGVRLFGPGDAPEVDPYEDFAARADLCEETVSTLTGSQQRYEFNGIIRADEVYADVFERFAVQMGGEDADVGGRAIVIPAEAKTPVLTLYDGDVEQLASTGFSDKKTRAEKVTAIEGRFCDPRQLYQPVDYPRIQNPAWIAADGEKPRTLTLNLIDETNVERAQRLATLVAKRARREGVIAEEYLANAPVGGVSPLKLEVGDWFVRRSEFHGFDADGKEFEVVELSYNWEANTVAIIGREVDPSDLAWQASQASDDPPPPPPDLGPGLIPVDTPSVSAEGVSVSRAGASLPGIEVSVANIDRRATRIAVVVESGDGAGGWSGKTTEIALSPDNPVARSTSGVVQDLPYRAKAKTFAGDQQSEWSAWAETVSPVEFIVPETGAADDFTAGGAGANTRAQMQQDISETQQGVADLTETYGSTASAAASADAAEAAQQASETARDQAQTAATNADGSAQSAAGSAQTATTKAGEASQSASAASASALEAQVGHASIFEEKAHPTAWTRQTSGAPANMADADDHPAISYQSGYLSLTGNTTDAGPKASVAIEPGRIYEVSADIEAVSNDGGVNPSIIAYSLKDDYTATDANHYAVYQGAGIAAGRVRITRRFSTVSAAGRKQFADASLVKRALFHAGARNGGTAAVARVYSIGVRDVTEAEAAAGSAASAQSSETAAVAARQDAEGAAAAAGQSESLSASSASDAGASATAAANSATLAESYADDAGNYAASAASSAEIAARIEIKANLIENADLSKGAELWNTSGVGGAWLYANTATIGRYWQASTDDGGNSVLNTPRFPVFSGLPYSASTQVTLGGSITNFAFIRFQWFDSSGTPLTPSNYADITASGAVKLENQIAPANAVEGRVDTYVNSVGGTVRLFWAKAEQSDRCTGFNTRQDDYAREASVQTFREAFVKSDGTAVARMQELVAASGSDPAYLSLLSGDGTSGAVLAAARVVLANLGAGEDEIRPVIDAIGGVARIVELLQIGGENFFLDAETQTLQIAKGSARLVIGLGFGSNSDLIMWVGSSATALGSMTKANAIFAIAEDLSTVGIGDGSDSTVTSDSDSATDAAVGLNWSTICTTDLSGVALSDLFEASIITILRSTNGGISSGSSFAGEWQLTESGTGGAERVMASGNFDVTVDGGGFAIPSGFNEYSNQRSGACTYRLKMRRRSGSNLLTFNGVTLRTRRTP